jgi:hypothetical protein
MMSELLYRAINPKEYLELADRLSSEPDETSERTAADRAYYAVFLVSRDTLVEKGYITPYYNAQDHQYVAVTLKRRDILGSLANDETRIRLARNLITYDTRDIDRNKQSARSLTWMLDTAKKIVERVESLPINPQADK